MKKVMLSVLVVALVVGQTDRGLAQRAGTPSELSDDAFALTLWRIAAATHTRIGFQSVDFVRQNMPLRDAPTVPLSSWDEVKAFIDANPRYEGRAMGDVLVVRPKTAWNDPGDPLNRRVSNLRVESSTESGALSGLRNIVYTGKFATDADGGKTVAFNMQSGTVLDVLNQVIQSADDVMWHAAYRPNARPDQRAPAHDLQLQLYASTVQPVGLVSCAVLPCVAKR